MKTVLLCNSIHSLLRQTDIENDCYQNFRIQCEQKWYFSVYEIRRIEPGVVQLFLLNGKYRFSSSHHRHMLIFKMRFERSKLQAIDRVAVEVSHRSASAFSTNTENQKRGVKINGLFVRINNEKYCVFVFSFFYFILFYVQLTETNSELPTHSLCLCVWIGLAACEPLIIYFTFITYNFIYE